MSDARTQRILSGHLPLTLLRFGAPLGLGMGLQTTFNLVDAYLISRLPSEVSEPALGAIGICDQLAALGTIISYGISVAAAALVSHAWGRGDREGAKRIAWQSVLLVLALGAATALVGGAGSGVLLEHVIGVKGQVAEQGKSYLALVMGGSVTMFLALHLATLLRAVGSSKTPIFLLLLGNALNLLLAVLFIYGPGEAPAMFAWGPPLAAALGVPRLELYGAGVATVIARALSLAPLVVFAALRLSFWQRRPPLLPEPASLVRISRLAWPSSAELVVRLMAMLFTHALVARAFTTESDQSATTALGIVFRFETMALFVSVGWGSAAQTFVGQNLGAGHHDRAKQSGYYAALYNALMMALLAALYVAFAPQIVGVFDNDPEILRIARSYLTWVAPSYVGLGIGIVLGCAMQGAGAPLQSLLLDAMVVFFLQVPMCLLVGFSPAPELWQVWLTAALSYAALAFVYLTSYRRGRFIKPLLA